MTHEVQLVWIYAVQVQDSYCKDIKVQSNECEKKTCCDDMRRCPPPLNWTILSHSQEMFSGSNVEPLNFPFAHGAGDDLLLFAKCTSTHRTPVPLLGDTVSRRAACRVSQHFTLFAFPMAFLSKPDTADYTFRACRGSTLRARRPEQRNADMSMQLIAFNSRLAVRLTMVGDGQAYCNAPRDGRGVTRSHSKSRVPP